MDAQGNLFGTTNQGGVNDSGSVWELPVGSSSLTTVAAFNGSNGANPFYGGVTFDANGNLFGTTVNGGTSGLGTVWEIQTASVPEPSTLVTSLIGLTLAGGLVRKHFISVNDWAQVSWISQLHNVTGSGHRPCRRVAGPGCGPHPHLHTNSRHGEDSPGDPDSNRWV